MNYAANEQFGEVEARAGGVAQLAARGPANRAIADDLVVTERAER
jgi:hypothetical protein